MVTINPLRTVLDLIFLETGKLVTADEYEVSEPIARLGDYNTEVMLYPKLKGKHYVRHSFKYNRIDIGEFSPIAVNNKSAVRVKDLLGDFNDAAAFDLSVSFSEKERVVNFTSPPLREADIIDRALTPFDTNGFFLQTNPNSYLFIGVARVDNFALTAKAPDFISFDLDISPAPVVVIDFCSNFLYEFSDQLGFNENTDLNLKNEKSYSFRVYKDATAIDLGPPTVVTIPSTAKTFKLVISSIKQQLSGFNCFLSTTDLMLGRGSRLYFVISRKNRVFALDDTDGTLYDPLSNKMGLFNGSNSGFGGAFLDKTTSGTNLSSYQEVLPPSVCLVTDPPFIEPNIYFTSTIYGILTEETFEINHPKIIGGSFLGEVVDSMGIGQLSLTSVSLEETIVYKTNTQEEQDKISISNLTVGNATLEETIVYKTNTQTEESKVSIGTLSIVGVSLETTINYLTKDAQNLDAMSIGSLTISGVTLQ